MVTWFETKKSTPIGSDFSAILFQNVREMRGRSLIRLFSALQRYLKFDESVPNVRPAVKLVTIG